VNTFSTSKDHPKRNVLRSLTAGLTGAALVATGSVALSGPAVAATQENDVVEVNDGSSTWTEQAYECFETGANLTPQQENVAGPQRAPFGSGSHHITINEYTSQTELYRTDEYDGTPLAQLSRLEYSSFARPQQADQPDRQPTYLRLTVDKDDDTTPDDSLFFIPANNGDQQAVENGDWQSWDVDDGHLSVNGDSGPGNTVTLDQYVQDNPNATLVNNANGAPEGGSIALVTGCGMGGDTDPQRNGDYFVDRVVVGVNDADTLYDFEGPAETDQGTTMQTVDPDSRAPWTSQAYDYQTGNTLNSNQTFVPGPATPPENRGSLRFTVSDDTNPNRIEQFRTGALDGRLLRDVRDLSYSTYVHGFEGNTTPQQPPYLYLRVDNDGDGTDDGVLFFYPANNADQQPVAPDTWQTWNAANGRWNLNGDDGPANSFTLDQYLAEHPDAVIDNNSTDPSWSGGGVTFQVGAGGIGQTNGHYYVDDITMSTADKAASSTVSGTEYDLEPLAQAPAPPQLGISDASVNEGDSGANNATFTISMDKTADRAVTVDYATSDGSAMAPDDYQSTNGTATIPAGETRTTVNVPVSGDTTVEPDEQFDVDLSQPQNASVGDGSATGTITNDDAEQPPPSSTSVSINDTSVSESNGGTAAERFTVSLDQPSNGVTTVHYATDAARGTAESTSDYTPETGTVTFQNGEQSKIVSITVNGDKSFEPDENLWVHLSNAAGGGNPEITDANGKGAIVNDDTRVGTDATNATGPHIQVAVNTTPDAARDPVKIYQRDAGKDTVLWSGNLDANGHVSKVPAKEFRKGNTVGIYSVVTTSNGAYASSVDRVTIQ
jgi:hypothetical protein